MSDRPALSGELDSQLDGGHKKSFMRVCSQFGSSMYLDARMKGTGGMELHSHFERRSHGRGRRFDDVEDVGAAAITEALQRAGRIEALACGLLYAEDRNLDATSIKELLRTELS